MLCEAGNPTIDERSQLITTQRERAEKELINIKEKIKVLEEKEQYYQDLALQERRDYRNPKLKC